MSCSSSSVFIECPRRRDRSHGVGSGAFRLRLAPTLFLLLPLVARSRAGAATPYGDLLGPLEQAYKDRGLVNRSELLLPQHGKLSFLHAGPVTSQKLVILLHGAIFSARTWQVVGTLDALADAGVRVLAPEMPGSANGLSGPRQSTAHRRSLLSALLHQLAWPHRALVVAASAGGAVGSPFVFAHPERTAGYVSVAAVLDAPSDANSSSRPCPVPTLVLWGELDSPARSEPTMSAFASAHRVIFPEAPHPCYVKDPASFNALVLAFAGAGGLMDRLGIAGEGAARLPIAADWSPPGLGKETYRK